MTALRLLGAVCVVTACTVWGRLRALALRRTAGTLRAVCRLLMQLKSEITELRTPLPELIGRLAAEAPDCCRGWLTALDAAMQDEPDARFASLWQRTLKSDAPPGLGEEETECLCLLGLSLGRYDAPEQGAAIDRCLRETERAQLRAEENARTQGRLFTGLGLAAGLLLAILLL